MKTIYKTIAIFLVISSFSLSNLFSQNWSQWSNGALFVTELFTDSINNIFYAGGKFIDSDGDTIKSVAKWNGASWDSIGSTNSEYGFYKLINYNDTLYSAGLLNLNVFKFNYTNWVLVGSSVLSGDVLSLAVYDNNLYAVGSFGNAIAKLEDTTWSFIPTNTALTYVWSAIDYKNELYIGGSWDADNHRTGVMHWDGNNWDSLGYGIENSVVCDPSVSGVRDLAVFNNDLYVAGCFYKTGSNENPDNCIGRWDGNNWHSVGGGLNGTVFKMVVYNGELYASGEFGSAGGVPADGIAKWDGTQWCSLGSNFYGKIYDMTVYNNELIVGGSFTQIDGIPINHIAKWIGGSYVDTCGNTAGVQELTENQNKLLLYPNPFTNSTTLQTTKPIQNASLFIYDMLGKKVKSIENINGTEITITRERMKSGMYFFTLVDAKGFVGNGKLIIE